MSESDAEERPAVVITQYDCPHCPKRFCGPAPNSQELEVGDSGEFDVTCPYCDGEMSVRWEARAE